ncbi:MAG TPA: peptidase S33, partial [Arthrobacter sp.]|nr:peptidase S33 [Arthrobacter sp.]
MPSTRRPGYTPGPRGSAPGAPASSRPDVISASKSDAGTAGQGGSGPSSPVPAPGKVLTFPEPKAKRRRRILLGTVAVIAVLIAGIVAAAVYSPWLAVRTVTVEGTRMLSQDQIQAALAP